MKFDSRTIIAFGIAFVIGASLFTNLMDWRVIDPSSDLSTTLIGIDTDYGITQQKDVDHLAEHRWKSIGTRIWVDPDLKGETTFKIEGRAVLYELKGEEIIDNAEVGQPDIIATITEPIPVVTSNFKEEITYQGQRYSLHKTTFEVNLKTAADSHGQTMFAEIGHVIDLSVLAGLGEVEVRPEIGDSWKGDVYLLYELRNHPDGFIYEVYINKDPLVGFINEPAMPLEAKAVPGIARAASEKMAAIAFYDAIDGQRIVDFERVQAQHGVMAFGGELGVGADPIIERHTWPLPDKFKGWNLYDTNIQYQIAVIIALPEIDPETGKTPELEGSTREEDLGWPQYYRTDVKDTEGFDDKLFNALGDTFGDFTETILLIIKAAIAIIAIIVILRILLWLFPRRQGS